MVLSPWVILFVCFFLQTAFCQTGQTCNTVDGEIGTCTTLERCKNYKIIASNILKEDRCRFDEDTPKVCCPISQIKSKRSTTKFQRVMNRADFVPKLLEPPHCGLSNASFNKVIGGQNAGLGDFPWMALVGYKIDIGINWECGGSLITSRHVLTAGHCIHNRIHELYVVRLGELDLVREDEGAHPIDRLIKKTILHENYNYHTYENDIGILVLQKDVPFSNSIQPICMPVDKELRTNAFEDFNPLVAGWGITSKGTPATHLQAIQIPIQNLDDCVEAFKTYSWLVLDERVICAGDNRGGKDACKGDSGGPLMITNYAPAQNVNYFYEIGLVSFGRGCAAARVPAVYTRVTQFMPWIEEKVLGRTMK